MINRLAEKFVRSRFEKAGIDIGTSDSSELQVIDSSFYSDVMFRGSLGLGNSYIEGKWKCKSIDNVVCKLLKSGAYSPLVASVYNFGHSVADTIGNLQNRLRSRQVVDLHYNLPPSFFEVVLGPTNQYTCAYFQDTNNLDQAQEEKLRVICEKLHLKKGIRFLDIGGGWGGLAAFAAKNYGVKSTVVTLSEEQAKYIQEHYKGFDILVFTGDYREIPDAFGNFAFDAVASVGCLEHIGHRNLDKFFKIVSQVMDPHGRFLLHNIYTPGNRPASNPWLRKHIFPNGELPTVKMMEIANKYLVPLNESGVKRQIPPNMFGSSPIGFNYHEEISGDYAKTLQGWHTNLVKGMQERRINLSDEDFRTWEFYFLSCKGAFEADHIKVGQSLFIGQAQKDAILEHEIEDRESGYAGLPGLLSPALRLMELQETKPLIWRRCMKELIGLLGNKNQSKLTAAEVREARRRSTLEDFASDAVDLIWMDSKENPRYATVSSFDRLLFGLRRVYCEVSGRNIQIEPGEFLTWKKWLQTPLGKEVEFGRMMKRILGNNEYNEIFNSPIENI